MTVQYVARIAISAAICASLVFSAPAFAQVEVRSAWVRGTVQGQKASGAYLEITSREAATLIGAESPAAGKAEIHEMRMEGDVMRMRAAPRIELPAGRTVELRPGGYHVMLIDLKRPLVKGDKVPLRLRIEGADKKMQTVEVQAEVRDLTAAAKHGAADHKH